MLRGWYQDCCTHFGMGLVPDTRRAKERQEGESGTRGEVDTRCQSLDKDRCPLLLTLNTLLPPLRRHQTLWFSSHPLLLSPFSPTLSFFYSSSCLFSWTDFLSVYLWAQFPHLFPLNLLHTGVCLVQNWNRFLKITVMSVLLSPEGTRSLVTVTLISGSLDYSLFCGLLSLCGMCGTNATTVSLPQ